jgi:penicillin-binding protein 1C
LKKYLLAGAAAAAIAAVLLLICISGRPIMPSYEKVRSGYNTSEARLYDRNGILIHEARMDEKLRRLDWVELGSVSEAMIKTVIMAEDRRFYSHSGVDWLAVAGSAIKGGSRGASTISMQVASFINPETGKRRIRRGFSQKLRQVKGALSLEEAWTKDQILEAYLNLAGFRGELTGIAASSEGIFMKDPSGINMKEAAVLCAMLPGGKAGPKTISERAWRIIKISCTRVDKDEIRELAFRAVSKPYYIRPGVTLAPHVARELLRKGIDSSRCSLDRNIQGYALSSLQERLNELYGRNVKDGAVIVADNGTGEILAYVGNSGTGSSARYVDGARAKRQAGSTLKPFLYGLAIEKRIITAASLIDDTPHDVPTAAGIYIPENYSNRYMGQVSARTALASSLNIPAVRVLELAGKEDFIDRLILSGFSTISHDAEYYGYSIALGSADISLADLTAAYMAIANKGVYRPLKLLAGEPSGPFRRVMDENAAYIITDILSDRQARSPTFALENVLATRFFSAVKTGTSKDMRDNWCIGFTRKYTVGVWVGNFSGEPMWNVSGMSGAAPVWLDIMNYLHSVSDLEENDKPDGVRVKGITYSRHLEPDRDELFIDGTEPAGTITGAAEYTKSAIVYPTPGAVLAIDPDIPENCQKVLFRAEPKSAYRWKLNGKVIGKGCQILWKPEIGEHQLVLIGDKISETDSVRFIVR